MSMIYCHLPLSSSTRTTVASNDDWLCPSITTLPERTLPHNVRLLRNQRTADHAVFALSGKLSDVCAALDHLAAQEALRGQRRATV